MSWLYERFEKTSEKNGRIICERRFGKWTVSVDGYVQSGGFAIRMFKNALARSPRAVSMKRALVLGFGGGCIIDLLHERFPGIEVTVIEWDPAMVEIAERIHLYKPEHAPQVLVGDAFELLPTLCQTFDGVIVDLFKGEELAPIVFLPSFIASLGHAAHADTLILLNAFRSKELLAMFSQAFFPMRQWRFEYNVLGWYRVRKP